MNKSLQKNNEFTKQLLESKIVDVEYDFDISKTVNPGELPEIIIVQNTNYYYKGSSKLDLFTLMSKEKGIIGKIVYAQDPEKRNPSTPFSIELTIVKQTNAKACSLIIGNVISSNTN